MRIAPATSVNDAQSEEDDLWEEDLDEEDFAELERQRKEITELKQQKMTEMQQFFQLKEQELHKQLMTKIKEKKGNEKEKRQEEEESDLEPQIQNIMLQQLQQQQILQQLQQQQQLIQATPEVLQSLHMQLDPTQVALFQQAMIIPPTTNFVDIPQAPIIPISDTPLIQPCEPSTLTPSPIPPTPPTPTEEKAPTDLQ